MIGIDVLEESMAPNLTTLASIVEQHDENHTEAHKRVRDDLRAFQAQMLESLQVLRDRALDNEKRIDKIETVPPDAERLIMTPRVVIGLVVFAVSIAGGIWSSTTGLRSDVRDILTRMDAQRSAIDATAKLQEVQSNSVQAAITDMKRRQELQQYEIQGLKEMMLTGKARTK